MSYPDFKVMSRYVLEDYLMNPDNVETLVVSITDIGAPLAGDDCTANNIHFLRLQFNDCEVSTKWETAMSDEQGIEVANFIKEWMNKIYVEKIIVQCEAGCSRSSGVCAAIMKYLTGDDMPIFRSPKYSPNMNCYRMVYNALFNSKPDDAELKEKARISDAMYFADGSEWDYFGGKDIKE